MNLLFTRWKEKSKKVIDPATVKSYETAVKRIMAFYFQRRKKYLIKKLYYRYYWNHPKNITYTQGEIIFKMKWKKDLKLAKNRRILRNWLWKFREPLKYYFYKYSSKVFNMKAKELAKQSK